MTSCRPLALLCCLLLLATLAAAAAAAVAVDAAAPTFPLYSAYAGQPYTVSYDRRSLRLNDQPVAFLSGSIHYPRSTPAMWPQLMRQAKADGLNMIEIYVFWNYHQPTEDTLDWSGRGNLTLFLDAVAEAGLFANLRIGPYVCAEWDYGGIPTWVAYKPGMRFRSYNQPWMDAVQRWFEVVVAATRTYFADHGGPIVLAQVENELDTTDQRYVDWNGELAAAMDVNVPWLMCNGRSANNTINTCNGNDCAWFADSHGQSGRILVDQPALWTENEGWQESWGDSTHPEGTYSDRLADDVAYTVARWFARGGSHMNYYMYHGGNHYGRTAAGGLTNMYTNGVLLRSDGLPNEPKHTHLARLHHVIAALSADLLAHDTQSGRYVTLPYRLNASGAWMNGTEQLAFVYGATVFVESSASVYLQTLYGGVVYDVAAGSVLILQGGKLLYNTSAVQPVAVQRVNTPVWDAPLEWQVWSEGVYTYDSSAAAAATSTAAATPAGLPAYHFARPVEQLNLTQDLTEYCWYTTRFTTAAAPPAPPASVNLSVDSGTAQAFIAYLDGAHVGSCYNERKNWPATAPWTCTIALPAAAAAAAAAAAGTHTLSLLSASLGIENGLDPATTHETHYKGIRSGGSVSVAGVDVTAPEAGWTLRPYLTGEYLALPSTAGHSAVRWSGEWRAATGRPLTWYYAELPAVQAPASGLYSVLLDMTGMTRGHAFVNGHDIGRYWLIEGSDGQPTQSLYHIPPDWLAAGEGAVNRLTVLEEVGSVDPSRVRLYVSQMLPTSGASHNERSSAADVVSG